MDFTELIASFAERHGIADLAAEDNAAALDIDGIVVTLVASGDAVSISADIGEPPAEGRASFADLFDVTYDPAMIKTAVDDMIVFLDGGEPEKDHVIPVSVVDVTNVDQFQGFGDAVAAE